MKKPRLYIAYGSNLNFKQMESRCPTADVVDTAVIKDYHLLFRGGDGSAVATIEPKEGSEVPVAIWSLEKQDEAALDRYEGYPFLYRKETVDIEINGAPAEAMVYIMNDGYPIGMPSARYFNTIQFGYEDNGLDMDVLFDALDYSEQRAGMDQRKVDVLQMQQLELEQESLDEQDCDEPGFELKM
jgi:gamma-glutamylcyclotransferase (GGCT)/AIG2-like uncharacterized protein YtfP